MAPRKVQGFTSAELAVALFILFLLLALGSSGTHCGGSGAITKGRVIQAVNHARQIHIATMSMANDGEANSNPEFGWPGDLKARGKIRNAEGFVNLLVRGEYLKPADLEVFCADKMEVYRPVDKSGVFAPAFTEKNNAFKIYLTKDEDKGETLFLATKNYTYNTALDSKAQPFGEEGFIVTRKAGDVSAYKKEQTQSLKIIGPLPGGGTVESAENCLNP